MSKQAAGAKIRLGISTCLLGERVRYDGGHKLDRYLVDTLGRYAEFVPVCPEMECGLGVPRESMRLVGDPESPRLVTTRSNLDMTDRMKLWAARRVRELEAADLCGFIFKSDSPSSGMARVRVYGDKGVPARKGVGLFARAFMERFPLVPVEDDGRLHDPEIRENFIERVFAFRRWKDIASGRKSRADLVRFHAEHKLMLMAHSEKHMREMGKLVAQAKRLPAGEIYARYQALLMDALKTRATVKKNCNVLTHMLGFFKKQLSSDEKQELMEVTERYRSRYVPLIVPITLFNHFVRKYDQPYLASQYYLSPHPAELALRNHV
jgi:uncharacterized protein YbgA (DUF1722 family)/uncharacterized protein YbbK (DUF523 family)